MTAEIENIKKKLIACLYKENAEISIKKQLLTYELMSMVLGMAHVSIARYILDGTSVAGCN